MMGTSPATPALAPPDQVAGLAGLLRDWWAQPLPAPAATRGRPGPAGHLGHRGWRPVPIRNDFGLWLSRDPRLAAYRETGVRLRARIVVTEARRRTLVLNAFAGYRLVLDGTTIAAPTAKAGYAFADLGHVLDLGAGAHELVVELALAQAPEVFAARLLPAAGVLVERVAPPGAGESEVDAEAFRYYDARGAAAAGVRQAWTSAAAFGAWQARFREAFARLLPAPAGAAGLPLGAEVVERRELPDHLRERLRITVEPGLRTDVYVLTPRGGRAGSGPWPALLCLHGHTYGKDDLVGEDRGDPARRMTIEAHGEDYALRYVRRGYVTAAPGMRLLADRGLPAAAWRRRDRCDNGFAQALMSGVVPAALDAWDARRVLELLAERPAVARDARGPRLGCLGLSYGGRATAYVAALDERVRVAVVSGAMNCLRERLTSFAGCGSQFVPGLFGIGDTPEVLASLAPRPLLLELGSRDGTSPALFAADMARTLERAYALAGAPERLAFDVFEGAHRFSGRLADAWLDRWL
jgi:dienelactone hydrolase